MPQQGTVARAFELARGGECRTVNDIRRRLKIEGLESAEGHLAGGLIKKQLIAIMKS